jgi:hypothetical protein
VRASGLAALLGELRSLRLTLREEVAPARVGPIVVSGVLAEQLAKQLGAGADPGAVVVGGTGAPPANTSVVVHVVAGDPSAEDEAVIHHSTTNGIDVVIVELWPQEDWTRPFVLSPFVVECRAGQGFPMREIADRIALATADSAALAASVPALEDSTRAGLVKQSVIRSALIGLTSSRTGAARPLLTLEQVRMTSRLRRVSSEEELSDDLPALAGRAAAVLASGFALRSVARSARTIVPEPVVHVAVAAAGTWALAKVAQLAESRLSSAE